MFDKLKMEQPAQSSVTEKLKKNLRCCYFTLCYILCNVL